MSYFNFPNTRTYDSDLGWLIKQMKKHDNDINKLMECCDEVGMRLDAIEAFQKAIEQGVFPDSIVKAFYKWCSENLTGLIAESLKALFFGLTDNGYFVAYIPESWEDITFNTTDFDIQIPGVEYGHLVLSY